MALAFYYLSQRVGSDGALQSGHVIAGAIGALLLIFLVEIAWFPEWLPRVVGVSVSCLQVFVFALVCIMFTAMCINTVRALSDVNHMAVITKKARVLDFDPNEVRDAVSEYRMIKGFDEKKKALSGFYLRKSTRNPSAAHERKK